MKLLQVGSYESKPIVVREVLMDAYIDSIRFAERKDYTRMSDHHRSVAHNRVWKDALKRMGLKTTRSNIAHEVRYIISQFAEDMIA